MTDQAGDFWDAQAATFDEEPDHGLLDPAVRAAWSDLLLPVLPPAPADVIDLGSGTGTLAVLLAQHGYVVRGLDLSEQMVTAALAKAAAAGVTVEFRPGDAAEPPFAPAGDVVLGRAHSGRMRERGRECAQRSISYPPRRPGPMGTSDR